MLRNDDYFAKNIILIAHIYLAVFVVLITTLLTFTLHIDVAASVEKVRPYAISWSVNLGGVSDVLQEKRELLSYIFSICTTCITLFFSLYLSHTYLKPKLTNKNLKEIYNCLIIISTIVTLIVLLVSFLSCYYLFYFPEKVVLYSSPFVILLGLFLAFSAVLYHFFGNNIVDKKLTITFALTALALSLFISSYAVFDEYSDIIGYSENFSPVTYPIIQEYLGKSLLINFKGHYGLYAYFMQWLLFIFPAKILTLSLSLAVLQLISLLSLAYCIFSITKNKLIAFIGFVALLYVQFYALHSWPLEGSVVFQYEPIRLLFPALLLGFLCNFFTNPSTKKYYLGVLFFSLGTLWNIDSGVPTFLTLVIVLGYERLYISNPPSFKLAFKHLAQCFGIFVIIWSIFFLLLRIKYNQWPIIPWLSYSHLAAFDFGYATLSIPQMGLWYVPLLIYIIGLTSSIHHLFAKEFSLQNSLVLSSSILGIGLFTYYLGRSHDTNIFHCGYPAIILLIVFSDKFCSNLVQKKWGSDTLLFVLPLLFISYLSSAFLFNSFSHETLKTKSIFEKFSSKSRGTKPVWTQELEFIKQTIQTTGSFARDDILILALHDLDYYFDLELRSKSTLDIINIRHMFYEKELNVMYDMIKNQEKSWVVLIQSDRISHLSDLELSKLTNLLGKHYTLTSQMTLNQNEETVQIYKPTLGK